MNNRPNNMLTNRFLLTSNGFPWRGRPRMRLDPVPLLDLDEDAALRTIVEGTAKETGTRFFTALVENLAKGRRRPHRTATNPRATWARCSP